MRTKFFSMFEIISKLPAVKSCAYPSELPRTELESSAVPRILESLARPSDILVVPNNGAA